MNSVAYNMDCMIGMKDTPDKYYELAIVDPPYGINVCGNKSGMGRRSGDAKAKYKMGDWDFETPKENYFKELMRVSKNQIIWGGNYFSLPPTKCFLIWYKMFSNELSFSACEFAWTSFSSTAKLYKEHPVQEYRVHPAQKPIDLYRWMLQLYANPGDKILDTHLGSGSSRIAAYQMGFDFTSYELDTDYFEAQEKRFKLVTSQTQINFKTA